MTVGREDKFPSEGRRTESTRVRTCKRYCTIAGLRGIGTYVSALDSITVLHVQERIANRRCNIARKTPENSVTKVSIFLCVLSSAIPSRLSGQNQYFSTGGLSNQPGGFLTNAYPKRELSQRSICHVRGVKRVRSRD